MPRCWIGLGGNLGDVPDTFRTAISQLSRAFGMRWVATSPLYRTAPMGADAGDEFLNAVVGFDVDRPALELLDLLQTVELNCGRVRTVHWGPRTLDLDLLYYGDQVLKQPRLTTPHPGLWYRRFVLDPLADVAPDWLDPVWQLNVSQLRDRLRQPTRTVTAFGAKVAQLDLLQSCLASCPTRPELRDCDVTAAMAGGVVLEFGTVLAPHVPRLRLSADISADALSELVPAVVSAAFDEPRPVA
jgi:2-amino-4-hydroxy-6-hydroxymethyldihydropteridine diphosphokinase